MAALLLCVASSLVGTGPLAVAQAFIPGTPWTGEPGVHQSNAQIMERQRGFGGRGRTHGPRPRLRRSGPDSLQNPGSPDVASWPDSGASRAVAAGAVPQTLGVSFTGATFADIGAFPPDSMGAAGPTQFIVACNQRIRSFNKSTGLADGALDADTDVFFSSVMTPPLTDNFTTDPRIRYDRLSGRWFVTMIDVPGRAGTLPNRILIGVSDDSTVTSNAGWTFYQFRHDQVSPAGDTGLLADYPTLGIDAQALYLGVNVFKSRGGGLFNNTSVFVVRKSSLLSGGPMVVTPFRDLIQKVQGVNTGPFTPQGVDNFDPAATEGYVIGVDISSYGRLVLRRISNPGGTPAISGNVFITVPTTGGTLTVPHLGNTGGTAGYLDGLDYRLLAAHLRAGRLWTSANLAVDNAGVPTGTDTRMGVRWYELSGLASGQTPAVVQSGTVYQPSASNTTDQRSYWMGTVMVSGQGHAAMGFSVAGASERINAGVTGRLANDPPGTMRAPTLYTASTTAYNPPGDSGGTEGRRWGDYSYTCVDPADDMTMWTIQEFCDAADSYGVRVVKLLAPPPATPVACNPAALGRGISNVSVSVTGVSTAGSGFYDPGPGFAQRLAAAVNGGGVTVESLSYLNPTNFTLHLSIAPSAILGARAITVTNPDGQVVTSAALLSVTNSGNRPPMLTPIADRTVVETELLTVTNSASDPEGQTLTFSLDTNAPPGVSINPSNGVLTWAPTEDQGPGSNLITVIVTDSGVPPASAAQTFRVGVLESNRPPNLTPVADQRVHVGMSLTVTNLAADPDVPANALHFTLLSAPTSGAGLDAETGVLTWTPSDADVGTNQFIVRVQDNGVPPLTDTNQFAIVVEPTPQIRSVTLVTGQVSLAWTAIPGQRYRVQGATNLPAATWNDVSGEITAAASLEGATLPMAARPAQFLRIRVVP